MKHKAWKFPCGSEVNVEYEDEYDGDFHVFIGAAREQEAVNFLVSSDLSTVRQLERMTAWMRKQLT